MYTQYILNQNIYRSKFRGNIELFWAKAISGFYTKYFGSYSLWYRISWMNCRKYKHFPQVNTGWLAFLRTWYYSRLCFSFSCAGCDHVVIKKSHTLNWYSLLVTVAAQFTIKTTNSKKSVYFLSLSSYSINKLKFQMLKILRFPFYVEKKNCSDVWQHLVWCPKEYIYSKIFSILKCWLCFLPIF